MSPAEEVLLQRHRWSLEDWHRMIDTGVVDEDDRVELICGEVVELSPAGGEHTDTLALLAAAFGDVAAQRHDRMLMHSPLIVPPNSEPEPDFLLYRPSSPGRRGKPTAQEDLLLVEVGATSIATDLRMKVPLYAAAGIPEVWVVDLPARVVLVIRELGANGYPLQRGTPQRPSGAAVLSESCPRP